MVEGINWIIPACAAGLTALALGTLSAVDSSTELPNNLHDVQRPRDLQTVKVNGEELSAPVLYLPPEHPNPSSTTPVSVIFPGNPGIAEFYVDMMYTQRTRANGNLHVYALGHVGQGLVLDEEKIPSSTTSPTFPRRITSSNFATIPHPGRIFSLREVIAHKLSVLTQLRIRHPQAEFIWSAHSMGAYVVLTVLRAMDDITTLLINGAVVPPAPCTVSEVERTMPMTPFLPSRDLTLKDEIVRITYHEEELRQWTLLVDPTNYRSLQKNMEGEGDEIKNNEEDSDENKDVDENKNSEDTVPKYESLLLRRSLTPERADGAQFVKQIQLLFPTVQRIADTPNGWGFTWSLWAARQGYLPRIARVISFMPDFMTRGILALHFSRQDDITGELTSSGIEHHAVTNTTKSMGKKGSNRNISSCLLLMHSDSVANAGMLYKDEAECIRTLDLRLLERHAKRINFYFSQQDDWAPLYQAEHIQALYENMRQEGRQTGTVEIDQHGLLHAFCTALKGSVLMGEYCIDQAKPVVNGW